jgi:Ca2+-dependent lipid-binding protein
MDVTGFADPYVKLSFDRQEFTTATIKKSVNPAWNEEFRIKVTPGSNDHYDVVFTIFDWDRMGDDEVIGEVRIPVNDFRSRTTEDVAFPVHKVNTDIPVIGKDKQESNLTVSCQLHALPYTYFHL